MNEGSLTHQAKGFSRGGVTRHLKAVGAEAEIQVLDRARRVVAAHLKAAEAEAKIQVRDHDHARRVVTAHLRAAEAGAKAVPALDHD